MSSLRDLRLEELISIRNEADALLKKAVNVRLGENDVEVDYDIRLRTSEGEVASNSGSQVLNGITHIRLLADAPRRFENMFMENVFSPINAEAYELFENRNPTGNNLKSIDAHTSATESAPGLHLPPVTIS